MTVIVLSGKPRQSVTLHEDSRLFVNHSSNAYYSSQIDTDHTFSVTDVFYNNYIYRLLYIRVTGFPSILPFEILYYYIDRDMYALYDK